MLEKIEEQTEAVWAILSDVHGQSPWTREQIEADIRRPETQYSYVHKQEETLGFLAVQYLDGELEVMNLAVRRAYQRQGLAASLLSLVLSRPEPVFLEVRASNQAAQALYEKFDFKKLAVRKDYYQCPKEDAILMKREANYGK